MTSIIILHFHFLHLSSITLPCRELSQILNRVSLPVVQVSFPAEFLYSSLYLRYGRKNLLTIMQVTNSLWKFTHCTLHIHHHRISVRLKFINNEKQKTSYSSSTVQVQINVFSSFGLFILFRLIDTIVVFQFILVLHLLWLPHCKILCERELRHPSLVYTKLEYKLHKGHISFYLLEGN